MYTHILVPLDGSERAERALPFAERIARATGSRITLLQAINATVPLGGFNDAGALSAHSMEADEAETTAYLCRVAGWPMFSGLHVETTVVTSRAAAAAILDFAQEQRADLIVMCSHGRTGAARWMLGSVADHVTRQSPVPVLVLREQGPSPLEAQKDVKQPQRIMVPLDGSLVAEAALTPAALLGLALAGPEHAELHLTLTLAPYEMDRESYPDALALEGARAYLTKVADRLCAAHPRLHSVSWSVTSGVDVAHAILRAAETGEDGENPEAARPCDLIAMATHGRSGVSRWAMGSIAERVLHGTRLPILIVRPTAVDQRNVPEAEKVESTSKRPIEGDAPWPALL